MVPVLETAGLALARPLRQRDPVVQRLTGVSRRRIAEVVAAPCGLKTRRATKTLSPRNTGKQKVVRVLNLVDRRTQDQPTEGERALYRVPDASYARFHAVPHEASELRNSALGKTSGVTRIVTIKA
jgi:hypothetical protein